MTKTKLIGAFGVICLGIAFGCRSSSVPSGAPAATAAEVPSALAPATAPIAESPAHPTTAEELSRVVLSALERGDRATLERLRVTEAVYRTELWPEFEAELVRNTAPVSFHWLLLDTESRSGLSGALGDYMGQQLSLVEVVPERLVEYKRFRLWKRVQLKVRTSRGADAPERVELVRVFGSLIEIDGRFWILSYPS
ncbi:MAG: hypothetical protein ACKVX7_01000 [Planctomycetota bacterium]